MPTNRRIERPSYETHRLSNDPNLADRSYFDPLTRENNGPRLKQGRIMALMEQPEYRPGKPGRK
jgi:hypothetical protein